MYLVMKVIYPQWLDTQNNNKNWQKQQITMFDDIKQFQPVSKCDSILSNIDINNGDKSTIIVDNLYSHLKLIN